MGLCGPPTVKKLLDRENVEKLLEVARSEKSSQIRREALNALGKIGGQEIIDGLVQALKDSNHGVREEAGRVFREIVDRLVQAVKDSDLIEQELKPC